MENNFNEILKELRKNQNKLQKDVAKDLNIETNTYGAWERGDTEPSIDMIKCLAKYFNCSIDYLLGEENEDYTKIQTNTNVSIPLNEERLLAYYRKLQRTKSKEFVESFIKNLIDFEKWD